MDEIMTQDECYIKGEEEKAEKKAINIKERANDDSDSPWQKRTSHYTLSANKFTPLNTRWEENFCKVFHTHDIPPPPSPKWKVMENDLNIW